MTEKYLPIGTVIQMKDVDKKIMIMGYASMDANKKDKIYDYCGCIYPEGVLSTDHNLLFDHNKIEKIISLGYIDEEEKEFLKKLKEAISSDIENLENITDAMETLE